MVHPAGVAKVLVEVMGPLLLGAVLVKTGIPHSQTEDLQTGPAMSREVELLLKEAVLILEWEVQWAEWTL